MRKLLLISLLLSALLTSCGILWYTGPRAPMYEYSIDPVTKQKTIPYWVDIKMYNANPDTILRYSFTIDSGMTKSINLMIDGIFERLKKYPQNAMYFPSNDPHEMDAPIIKHGKDFIFLTRLGDSLYRFAIDHNSSIEPGNPYIKFWIYSVKNTPNPKDEVEEWVTYGYFKDKKLGYLSDWKYLREREYGTQIKDSAAVMKKFIMLLNNAGTIARAE